MVIFQIYVVGVAPIKTEGRPWLFRQRNIGPLIGKRTWGGLVGIVGFPR